MLQQEPQDAMLLYMQAIVDRMDNPTTNFSSTSSPIVPAFKAPPEAIRINLVWFAGLVLTLTSALVGILGKQWLREYLSQRHAAPRDAVRLRQFRYAGLVHWRVADIIAMLPLLLQAALIFFIVGLLDLMWSIADNTLVAAFSTSIVGIGSVLVITSVLLPLFFPDCPFKSPLALQIRQLYYLISDLLHRGPFKFALKTHTRPLHHGWYDTDVTYLLTRPEAATSAIEHSALTWAHQAIVSDKFQVALAPCVYELPPALRVQFVHATLAQHAGLPAPELARRLREGPQEAHAALHRGLLRAGHKSTARLLGLLLDVLPDAVPRDQDKRSKTLGLGRLELLHVIHPLLNAFVWTGKQQYSTRDAVTRRVYEALLSLLGYQGQSRETMGAVFGLLLTFSHLFWKFITPDDVSRMLDAALQQASAPSFNSYLDLDSDPHHDTCDVLKTAHQPAIDDIIVIAAPAVLNYTFALSSTQLVAPSFRAQLSRLQPCMAAYIRHLAALRQPYVLRAPVRVSWAWELCRLAQRDAGLVHGELVMALMESDRAGLLPASEKGPLLTVIAALAKAGLDVSVFRRPPPTFGSPVGSPTETSRATTLAPSEGKRSLLAPLVKLHARTRSKSSSGSYGSGFNGIAPALIYGAVRTASSSSGLISIMDSPMEMSGVGRGGTEGTSGHGSSGGSGAGYGHGRQAPFTYFPLSSGTALDTNNNVPVRKPPDPYDDDRVHAQQSDPNALSFRPYSSIQMPEPPKRDRSISHTEAVTR
jgi:hypothetical protein